MKDLVILAADKDLEFALRGILSRPEALGVRKINVDIFVEPEHDPACALRGVQFLSNFAAQYRFGLLMFDHEGSGKESVERRELQRELNKEFNRSDWGDRAKAIVLSPELEIWAWGDSPHIDDVIGWKDAEQKLRPWLIAQGFMNKGEKKPHKPKDAFELVLRTVRKPRSSSLFKQIAQKVSLKRCEDKAFLDFKAILKRWLPQD